MSNLIAVAYDDVESAKNVLSVLNELSVEHAITLAENQLREALSASPAQGS